MNKDKLKESDFITDYMKDCVKNGIMSQSELDRILEKQEKCLHNDVLEFDPVGSSWFYSCRLCQKEFELELKNKKGK